MRRFFRRHCGIVLAMFFFGLLFGGRSGYAEPELKKLITVAGDENFPPYEFLDERNGLKIYRGFNIDLIRAVMAKTDLDVQFVPLPWEEAVRALQDGRVDAVGGMKYDAERSQRFDFSEEYLINSLAIFVPTGNSLIVELEDLDQKKVAVQKDDIAYQKLKNRVSRMTATVSQEEAMKLLVDGKVDAVVGNKMAGQYVLQRLGAMDSVKTVGGIINPERYGMAVRRGNSEFLAKFNDGLRKIRADGTYDSIYVKWFGEPVDYPAYYYKKYLKYLAGGLTAMAILIVIFLRVNYVLKREVAKRTEEISRVNAELIRKNAYIKNVNQYQSSVLNSGYGGILTSDAAGVIRFANRYACEHLGVPTDPVSLNLREIPNCGWIREALDNGTAAGEVLVDQNWLEYAILRLGADNQTEEIIIHFRDITEDKYLRAEVVKSQKMEALGQLVASIAHEIRTPLTSIKAFTELLPHKYDNPDFREKISRFVPQEIERLNRVVNDLLTYSNPPAVQKEKILLKALVDDVMVYFVDAFSRQDIQVRRDLDERLWVTVDKNQMKQVLINVLLNAVQALKDQAEPRLTLASEWGADGQLALSVCDNGPGIAPPVQAKVFEPFFTTKSDGTGLGLFVSYQLARRNDVEIRLNSNPGLGTEVRLIFSRDQEGAA